MKIAVYHNLPSGGGKRALFEMTRGLAQRHTIDVFTLSCAEHDFCDLRPIVNTHTVVPFHTTPLARRPFGRLNQGIRALDLYRVRRSQQRIAAQIDAGGYDVAFVHNCQFNQSPGLLSYLQTPSAYYCGEPPRKLYEPDIARPYNTYSRAQQIGNLLDPFPRLYRAALARLDRRHVRAATSVLTNSAYSRESIYRIYSRFSDVCYLGVDVDQFRPLSLPREQLVISVGSLNSHKGFDFLIHSLAQIEPANRPALIIVGNSADQLEAAYLRALADRLQVSVTFRVMVTDDELVTLYNRASLTLYTPIMEPFGFVPLESMACETPVIGVREAGVRESVVDAVTGVLVDRDIAAMAQAIQMLLSAPDRARQLGRNGRQHVEAHWTWAWTTEVLETQLDRAARHGRQRSGTTL